MVVDEVHQKYIFGGFEVYEQMCCVLFATMYMRENCGVYLFFRLLKTHHAWHKLQGKV